MMILCPSCDTGFKLPDKHITSKGAKLRCSKCSHIFRVRRVEGLDDPEIFYKEEDRLKNDENGTSLDEESDGFGSLLKSDDAPSKQTHFGLAGFGAGSSGEIPIAGRSAKLDIAGAGVPPKPVIPGLEDDADDFGDALDEEIVEGSGTMLGRAIKPASSTSLGGFGGGLDFGDLDDSPKARTSFGMARPTTQPRKKFSGANKSFDLGALNSPAPSVAEPQGTALGAPGIKARSGRRGDLLDSSLFGDSSSAEDSSGPSPMVVVPESEAREEVSSREAEVDAPKSGDLDFGSFGLSDAIDDAMRAREEKKASREKARAARAPKFEKPEPKPTPERAPLAPLDNESSGIGLDLFGDADEPDADAPFDDPFGGAFGEEDEGNGLDFASLAQAASEAEPEPEPEPELDDPILVAGQPGMASRPSPEPQHGGAHGVSIDMPDDEMQLERNDSGGDDFWGQKDSYFGPADSLVDTGYDDSAGFDPNVGAVEPEPVPEAPQPVAQRPRPAPVDVSPEPRPEPAPPGRARRGSSSVDKAKNGLIIGGGVLFGFLAVLIVLNDGVIDFKRFGVTLESAFTDKPFTPRPEWVSGSPAADPDGTSEGDAADPDDSSATKVATTDLEVGSTSASFLSLKKVKKKQDRVVAVRGSVLNRSNDAYVEVRVRVMLLNAKEQIVGEKEVPVGGFVTDAEISKEKNPIDAAALAPSTPTKIPSRDAQSFTAIFDEIPKEVTPEGPIFYKVEFTKKVSEADLASAP